MLLTLFVIALLLIECCVFSSKLTYIFAPDNVKNIIDSGIKKLTPITVEMKKKIISKHENGIHISDPTSNMLWLNLICTI